MKNQVLEIRISELAPNPAQPPDRTTSKKVHTMAEALKRDGQITPIHVHSLNGRSTPDIKYMIITGHTRVAALSLLGKTTVTAIEVPVPNTPALAWAREAVVTRRVSGGQWFTSWAQLPAAERAGYLNAIIPYFAANIRLMVKIFGESRTISIARSPRPIQPGVARIIVRTHEALKAYAGSKITIRELGEWIIANGMQADLAHAFPRVAMEKTSVWKKLDRSIRRGRRHERGAW